MSLKYPHLLSPIKIGNIVFKNRMTSTCSFPHFLQGLPPSYAPTEEMIANYANRAKNGAAVVTANWIGHWNRDLGEIITVMPPA